MVNPDSSISRMYDITVFSQFYSVKVIKIERFIQIDKFEI